MTDYSVKKGKNIIVIGLIILLTIILPAVANAETVKINGIYYDLVSKTKQAEVRSSPNDDYSGDIVIPKSVKYNNETYSVTSIGGWAFATCNNLTTITIPNSVKTIGERALAYCDNLTTVTIPSSVTDIGTEAFSGSNALKKVNLPNSITTISSGLFYACHGLVSMTIPSSVTSISRAAFSGCSHLATITIPNSVVSIGDEVFRSCNSLLSVIIPNSVTSLGNGVFGLCENLSSVTLPDNITSIGDNTFGGCWSLSSINIPNKVTSIGKWAFSTCRSLTDITIPNGVKKIDDYAFQNCSGLKTVTIPNSVTTIGSKAFAKCSELVEFYCYAVSPPQTKSDVFEDSFIDYASLYVPEGSIDKYKVNEPWKNFKEIIKITNYEYATYTLSIKATGNGSVLYNGTTIRSKTSSFTVNEGASPTITFSPDDEYRIKSVKVNSTDVTSSISNNQYTISNITANTTLDVEFEYDYIPNNLEVVFPTYESVYNQNNSITVSITYSQFSKFLLNDGLFGMQASIFDSYYVANCVEGGTVNSQDAPYVSANAEAITQNGRTGYRMKIYNFGNLYGSNVSSAAMKAMQQGAGASYEEKKNIFENKELGTAIYFPHGEGTAKHTFSWTLSPEELDYLTKGIGTNEDVLITRWICFAGNSNAPYPYIWIKMTIKVTINNTAKNVLIPSISLEEQVPSFKSVNLTFNSNMKQVSSSGIGLTGTGIDGSKALDVNVSGKVVTLSLPGDEEITTDGNFVLHVPAGSFEDPEGYANVEIVYAFSVYEPRNSLRVVSITPESETIVEELPDPIKVEFDKPVKLPAGTILNLTLDGEFQATLGNVYISAVNRNQIVIRTISMKKYGTYVINVPEGTVHTTAYGTNSAAAYDRWNAEFNITYTIQDPYAPINDLKAKLETLKSQIGSAIGYPVAGSDADKAIDKALDDIKEGTMNVDELKASLEAAIAAFYAETDVVMPAKESWYYIKGVNGGKGEEKKECYLAYSGHKVTVVTSQEEATPFKAVKSETSDSLFFKTADGYFITILPSTSDNTTTEPGKKNGLDVKKLFIYGVDNKDVFALFYILGWQGRDAADNDLGFATEAIDYTNNVIVNHPLVGWQPDLYFDAALSSAFTFVDAKAPTLVDPEIALSETSILTTTESIVLTFKNLSRVELKDVKKVYFSSDALGEKKVETSGDVDILTKSDKEGNSFIVHLNGLNNPGIYYLQMPEGTFDYSNSGKLVTDVKLAARFSLTEPVTKYNISISASGNGYVTYNGTTIRNNTYSYTVNEGTNAAISITPDNGYRIKRVWENYSDVTSYVSNNTYTIYNISRNTTLEVEFEAIPVPTYTLSITATGYGSATYDGTTVRSRTTSFTVNEGTNAIVTFSPDNGNSIASVRLNNNDVTSQVSGNRYTINNITANTTLTVTFQEDVNAMTVDGVNYTVVSQADRTVKVTGGDFGQVLTVPATVTQNGKTWTVTGIDTNALKNNTELAAVIWNPTYDFTATVSNPNLLLYVKSSGYAPSSIQNVVVNGTASNIVLKETSSGNNFYCPQTFVAQKISYTHNYQMQTGLGESKGWETIALPFDVQTITHETKGTIVPFAQWNNSSNKKPFWLMELTGTGFVETGSIKAYTPYIISMPNNPQYDSQWLLKGKVTFAASSVTVSKTENLNQSVFNGRTFIPCFAGEKADEGFYALNVSNDWETNNSGMTEGSKFVLNMRRIHPFEAYMISSSNAAPYFDVFDDMTTGIQVMDEGRWMKEEAVYDLQGRKVENPSKKGVYIVNGKKKIIK